MFRLTVSVVLLIYLFLFTGCSLEIEKRKIAEYKLKDGDAIELIYRGGGATAPDYIEVKKKGSNSIIHDIKGFDDRYLFSFNQLNDSLLKVTFTDTAYFKGQRTDVIINLNNRISGYWDTSQAK
jgi:hypothetical protein